MEPGHRSPTKTEAASGGNAAAAKAPSAGDDRRRLLAGLPVRERRLEAAGIETAVLEGGEGPPLVLLHGPGEFAAKWMRVLPALVEGHRVVAPDLPAHGASAVPDRPLDTALMLAWLEELVAGTCSGRPTLVGHVLGGAIAARFAVTHGETLDRLVLVDTLGLARFRPKAGFGLSLLALQARPSGRAYDRFMRHCSVDFDGLRAAMGERWAPYREYSLELARSPRARAMRTLMRQVGLPPIPAEDLAAIEAPTSLIWGREDEANRLRIAEAASERFGWPLHVIDDCADDPARDRPDAFLRALAIALGATDALELAAAIAPGWWRQRAFIEAVTLPVREWMIESLRPRSGDTVLELAAGAGDTGFDVAAIVGARGRLFCTDFSPEMLDLARRRGAQRGVDNVDYRLMDAERIELDDDAVDAVLCRFGYMLMPDPAAALGETRRVLRPGGRLALAVWGPAERNPWASLGAMALLAGGHLPPPDPHEPGMFALADEERLAALITAAGFEDVSIAQVPVLFSFASQDAYEKLLEDAGGPMTPVLRGLSGGEREALRRELDRTLTPFATEEGYELPGLALAAVAS